MRDRLAQAHELRAFQWGLEQARTAWELAVKLDADLELCADLFAALERTFQRSPRLGIAGAHLSVIDPRSGLSRRERNPARDGAVALHG